MIDIATRPPGNSLGLAGGGGCPSYCGLGSHRPSSSSPSTAAVSWMLVRRFSLRVAELRRMKYFWAWLATWVGVRDVTKVREMERQSPLPNLDSPCRNSRCSSSVQGTPLRLSWSCVRAAALELLRTGCASERVRRDSSLAAGCWDSAAHRLSCATSGPAADAAVVREGELAGLYAVHVTLRASGVSQRALRVPVRRPDEPLV